MATIIQSSEPVLDDNQNFILSDQEWLYNDMKMLSEDSNTPSIIQKIESLKRAIDDFKGSEFEILLCVKYNTSI